MYKTLSFKTLSAVSGGVCVLLILSAALSAAFPVKDVLAPETRQLSIIMYHQISENRSIWGNYVIPEEKLRADFQYMKNNGFNPVSLKTVQDFVSGKSRTLPKNAVVITFDDGERSFLTKVLPLLKEFNYPAVVSIVGALADMYTKNGETNDAYAYLNWDDIKELSKEPLIEIGNHSYNMHSLGTRRGMGKIYGESDEAYKKIIASDFGLLHAAFKERLLNQPTILAYPYGIRNNILFEYAKSEGYTVTLTCSEKINRLKENSPLYELGRFNRPYKESCETFFAKLEQS